MGMEFEYDQSGNTSYVFLLSALVIYLGLATCRKAGGADDIKQSDVDETIKKHTPTTLCYEKQKQLHGRIKKKRGACIPIGSVVYWGAWVAFIAIVLKVSTFETEAIYSPFDILGLDEDAETKEIKQKYRDLSRQYHPDRNPDDEEAAEKFMKIRKAYEALTDEVTRENWEKYGNPDGRQIAQFGIALPAWIVDSDNSHLVLGAYVFVFMLCLPTYIGCWWYNRTNYYSDDVMLQTMKVFGTYIQQPIGAISSIVEKISWCEEYQLIPIRETQDRNTIPKLVRLVPDLPEIKKWRYPNLPGLPRKTPACLKSRALLHAHLEGLRNEIPLELIEDLNFCLKRVPMLIDAILEVLPYRQPHLLRSYEAAMHLCQMLVQGCPREKEDPFMQIPHMTTRLLKSIKSKKTRIATLADFFSLTEDTRRSLLSKDMDETQMLDVEVFGGMFPFLKCEIDVKVADEADITAGSLVTVSVLMKRQKMSDLQGSVDEERLLKKLSSKDGATPEDVEDEKAKIVRQYAQKTAKKGKKPNKKKAVGKKEKQDSDTGDVGEKKESGGDDDNVAISGDTDEVSGTTNTDADEENKTTAAASVDATNNDDSAGNDEDDDEDDEDDGADEESSDDDFDWGDDETFLEQQEKQQKAKEKKMKGKESHPVHCPWFPEPKQEWWWVFIADAKNNAMITPVPQKIQSLTDDEEVDLQFMAPPAAGTWNLTVYVVSDSYYGIDVKETFKLDVKGAIEQPNLAEQIESEDEDPFMIEESEDSDEDDFA